MRGVIILFWALVVATVAVAQVPETPAPNGQPQTLHAYVTGDSNRDNTPPAYMQNSHSVLQAVGHQIIAGEDVLDFPVGTLIIFQDP